MDTEQFTEKKYSSVAYPRAGGDPLKLFPSSSSSEPWTMLNFNEKFSLSQLFLSPRWENTVFFTQSDFSSMIRVIQNKTLLVVISKSRRFRQ